MNSKWIALCGGIAAVAVLTAPLEVAASKKNKSPEEKAYEYRDGVFHAMGWKFGQLAANAARGNKAEFQRAANDMVALSQMTVEGFIPNSIVPGSLAKKEIWENWDDFNKRAEDLTAALRTIAADDYDISTFSPKEFGKNCGNCHREYKKRT